MITTSLSTIKIRSRRPLRSSNGLSAMMIPNGQTILYNVRQAINPTAMRKKGKFFKLN